MLRFLLALSSATAILVLLVWGVGGAASAQSPEDAGTIQEIKPIVPVLNVGKGFEVLLSITVIGLDGNEDQSLASTVDLSWSASAGNLAVQYDTTRAIYLAPRILGTHTVTASAGSACVGDATDCNATFTIRVRTIHRNPPYNPPGEIPTTLEDAEGNQYAVFTPEEGGTFKGDQFWVSASRGEVPNGEYIGIRMYENGPAADVDTSHHAYTFSGNQYKISVVDAKGIPIASYTPDTRVEACIPVPDELIPSLQNIVVVAKNNDGTLTATSLRWQITRSSYYSCGFTSTLPTTIAVGIPGTPPMPEPTPALEPALPVTGGAAPSSTIVLAWTILIGFALIATGMFAVYRRRRQNQLKIPPVRQPNGRTNPWFRQLLPTKLEHREQLVGPIPVDPDDVLRLVRYRVAMVAVWCHVTNHHRCAVYLGQQLAHLHLTPDVHVWRVTVDAVRHIISQIGNVEHLCAVDNWVSEVRQIVEYHLAIGSVRALTRRVYSR